MTTSPLTGRGKKSGNFRIRAGYRAQAVDCRFTLSDGGGAHLVRKYFVTRSRES